MRNLLLAALAALTMSAQAATTNINVIFVFTPGGLAQQSLVYAGHPDPAADLANDAINRLNEDFQGSGVTVNFVPVAIFTAPSSFAPTTPQAAATAARTNYPIMKARDDSNADIVVVIGDFPFGNGTGSDSCSTTDPGAVVAINGAISPSGIITHEVGHCFNAQHQRGVVAKVGTTRSDCKVYYTVDQSSIDRSFPVVEWRISEGNLTIPQGYGDSPGQATRVMSSFCPQANNSFWTYTCAIESCERAPAPPPPGTSVLCYHTRNETYSAPGQPIQTFVKHIGTPASYGPTQFLCETVIRTQRFSGLGLKYAGIPIGDSTHDNVHAIFDKLPSVANYHNIKVSPSIPH